jgi:vancomycin resistance protein YoaR
MRVYRFEEPISRSLGPPEPPSRRRPPWRPLLAVLAVLAALVAVAAVLARPLGDQLPEGTRIGGVDVGGMTRDEAEAAVRAHGREVVARGVVLIAEGNRFQLDPQRLRIAPAAKRAVAAAAAEPGAADRLRLRLGLADPPDVPLTYTYNRAGFLRATTPIKQAVAVEPVSASIDETTPRYRVAPASDGRRIDRPAVAEALRDLGRTGPEIQVPTIVVPPAIATEKAEAAAAEARLFVSTRHVVELGQARRTVPKPVLRRAADFRWGKADVRFVVAEPPLRAFFSRAFPAREKAPRNARFTVNANGKARIIAGRDGRGVDTRALARTWQRDPGQSPTAIAVGPREPDLTTEEAQAFGVEEVVGEFFTPYSGGSRVINIQLAAKILDQMVIRPNQTFSLNEALGQRTTERGFVEAPMIGENNVLVDSVGGGVSQVATTVFNAAFFAGLELIDHTPHSFWISRYPMGREATVSWGGPELIFRNNWDAPIVILTRTDDSGIRVMFLSQRLGRRVEATEGEPRNATSPRTIRIRDRSLPPGTEVVEQAAGSGGFTIDYGRRVFRNGKLVSRETWTWRYGAENAIIRVGPKVRPVAPADEGGDGGGEEVPPAEDGGEVPPAEDEQVAEGAT